MTMLCNTGCALCNVKLGQWTWKTLWGDVHSWSLSCWQLCQILLVCARVPNGHTLEVGWQYLKKAIFTVFHVYKIPVQACNLNKIFGILDVHCNGVIFHCDISMCIKLLCFDINSKRMGSFMARSTADGTFRCLNLSCWKLLQIRVNIWTHLKEHPLHIAL